MNYSDSDIIRAVLLEKGFSEAGSESEADLIVVNSCGVKGPTEKKIVNYLQKWNEKKLIIAGCLPRINPELVRKTGIGFIDNSCPERIYEAVVGRELKSEEKKDKSKLPKARRSWPIAVVAISEGCLGRCTYCGTKNARGDLFSFDMDSIVAETKNLVSEGYKEIQISSQDTGCYGQDSGTSITELLNRLLEIEGDYRLRVGMMNPGLARNFYKDLADIYADQRVYNFLHLPLQSGSDRVLRAMERNYTVRNFERIFTYFRKRFDNFSISTDIIVGFPGETEEDFTETYRLIEKLEPDITNISKFCKRPNTKAEKMEQLDSKTIKERSGFLSRLCMEIGLRRKELQVGKTHRVLMTGKRKGRDQAYRQVFTDRGEPGETLDVKIVSAGPRSLKGKGI